MTSLSIAPLFAIAMITASCLPGEELSPNDRKTTSPSVDVATEELEKTSAEESGSRNDILQPAGLKFGASGDGLMWLTSEDGEKNYLQPIDADGKRGEKKLIKNSYSIAALSNTTNQQMKISVEGHASIFVSRLDPDNPNKKYQTSMLTHSADESWTEVPAIEVDSYTITSVEYDSEGNIMLLWGNTFLSAEADQGLWWATLDRDGKLGKSHKLSEEVIGAGHSLGASPEGKVIATWWVKGTGRSANPGLQILTADYQDGELEEPEVAAILSDDQMNSLKTFIDDDGVAVILWKDGINSDVIGSYRAAVDGQWSAPEIIYSKAERGSNITFEFFFGAPSNGGLYIRDSGSDNEDSKYFASFSATSGFGKPTRVKAPKDGFLIDVAVSQKGELVASWTEKLVSEQVHVGTLGDEVISKAKTVKSHFMKSAIAVNPANGDIVIAGQPLDAEESSITIWHP